MMLWIYIIIAIIIVALIAYLAMSKKREEQAGEGTSVQSEEMMSQAAPQEPVSPAVEMPEIKMNEPIQPQAPIAPPAPTPPPVVEAPSVPEAPMAPEAPAAPAAPTEGQNNQNM